MIHIYYTREGIALFADDTSLFLTVYNPNISADQLDKDLKKYQIGHTNGK